MKERKKERKKEKTSPTKRIDCIGFPALAKLFEKRSKYFPANLLNKT